jgi:endonuclease/exonuclease/phosphatase family metal-dependent hydrolase
LAYVSVFIPPEALWISAFFALSIPLFLVFHSVLLVFWGVRRSFHSLFPLLGLLLGWPFAEATFQFPKLAAKEAASLGVLSYNVRVFNQYHDESQEEPKKMIEWVVNHPADIKCLQEYFEAPNRPIYNVVPRFRASGYSRYFVPVSGSARRGRYGLAIYSRYPIVRRGVVPFKRATYNKAIFADIVLPKQDTLRVYNAHLQSMHIDESAFTGEYGWERKFRAALLRYRRGVAYRSQQAEAIAAHAAASPYPVIVCADLNDPPYSFSYFHLKQHLESTFEKAGQGFGFSYNGPLWFLRIDHQFAGGSITPVSYQNHRDAALSDHFPNYVKYRIGKEE